MHFLQINGPLIFELTLKFFEYLDIKLSECVNLKYENVYFVLETKNIFWIAFHTIRTIKHWEKYDLIGSSRFIKFQNGNFVFPESDKKCYDYFVRDW